MNTLLCFLYFNTVRSFSVALEKIGGVYAAKFVLHPSRYPLNLILSTTLSENALVFDTDHAESLWKVITSNSSCISFFADNTLISFQDISQARCSYVHTDISFDNSNITFPYNFSLSSNVSISNTKIHNWTFFDGILGLNYCNFDLSLCKYSPFQRILSIFPSYHETNYSSLFLIDLNTPDYYNDISSTLYLNEIPLHIESLLSWSETDPNYYPTQHRFFMYDLSFCGHKLTQNFSSVWPAIIDTTSICTIFPKEIYDTFVQWLNNNPNYQQILSQKDLNSYLPPLYFSNHIDGSILYISLRDHIIASDVFDSEEGHPSVYLNSTNPTPIPIPNQRNHSLCILSGDSIYGSSTQNLQYSQVIPSITLGSLALQSLYFASDMSDIFPSNSSNSTSTSSHKNKLKYSHRIGLANKIPLEESIYQSNPNYLNNIYCVAPKTCLGHQFYDKFYNKCELPLCAKYLFMNVDESTGRCYFNTGFLIVFILFLSTIIIAEFLYFFVMAFSAHQLQLDVNKDWIAIWVGKILAIFIDFIIIYILNWYVPPQVRGTTSDFTEVRNDVSENDHIVVEEEKKINENEIILDNNNFKNNFHINYEFKVVEEERKGNEDVGSTMKDTLNFHNENMCDNNNMLDDDDDDDVNHSIKSYVDVTLTEEEYKSNYSLIK